MRHIRAAQLSLAVAFAGTVCANAQTVPTVKEIDPPKTILYVGNSFYYFNNSMHSHVLRLTNAADPQNRAQYRSTSVTISGSGLNWHDVES